jgi:hypothetical protein
MEGDEACRARGGQVLLRLPDRERLVQIRGIKGDFGGALLESLANA